MGFMKEIRPHRSKVGPFCLDGVNPNLVYLGKEGGYVVSGFLVDRHEALEPEPIARKSLFLDVGRHNGQLRDYLIILEEQNTMLNSALMIGSTLSSDREEKSTAARFGFLKNAVFDALLTVPLSGSQRCKFQVEEGGEIRVAPPLVEGFDIYDNYVTFQGDCFELFGDQYMMVETADEVVTVDILRHGLEIVNRQLIRLLMEKLNLNEKFSLEEEFVNWWFKNRPNYPWLDETIKSAVRRKSFVFEASFPQVKDNFPLKEIEDWLSGSPQTASEVADVLDSLCFSTKVEEVSFG